MRITETRLSDCKITETFKMSASPLLRFLSTGQITHPPTVVSDHVMPEISVCLLFSGE
jgi:hypothetical protein